ncbi:hypothetical protein SARC_04981 [Sphaeroforma arctica JP610]|uniref:Uncharacterized protein n=1 Tax=Sphaeroforma arctica JP610 TaxID=667725 RepID=A0A0L0G0Y9_9EUKA|nr:hypothetical protein SARC_04981 [Sphaeroforma arctica JP610]KNC82740.1 hypothetical protein SARC_04981 [Sphaeroforma arctica JP610]|eukprot:XP_014156642.1 hypothetical protein SARC_04981 [Sphaeroforma arctica JP610]
MYTLADRVIEHRQLDCDKENKAPLSRSTMPAGHLIMKPCQTMRESSATAPFKTRTRQPLAQGKDTAFLSHLANRTDPAHLKGSSSWDEYDCSVALLNLAQQEPKAVHASPEKSNRSRNVYCQSGQTAIGVRKQMTSTAPKQKHGNYSKVTFHRTKPGCTKQLRKLEISGGSTSKSSTLDDLQTRRRIGMALNLGDRFKVLKMPSELVKRPSPGQKMDLRIKWRQR